VTTQQLPLPDGAAAGLALRDAALGRMSERPWVQRARNAARLILSANGNRPISIDNIYAAIGPPPEGSPNQAGCVFATKEFRLAGYTRSRKPEGHFNRIGLWERAP